MTGPEITCRLGVICVALVLTLAPISASGRAEGRAKVEIEHMTWMEVRDAIRAGKTTAIIPTGGTEQNGPHMVTGKHNFVVAETARRIARELGDALVAPVIAYVPEGDIEKQEGHMAYAGTISVPDAVYAGLLEATAASLRAHGFKTIVFLGDSGGNIPPQRSLAQKLTKAWARDGVRVVNAEAYYAANGGEAWLKAEGETETSIGTHAGIRDTSELLAVLPSGVDLRRAGRNANGATGDATRASAQRGEKLIAMKVAAAVAEIRKVRSEQTTGVPARQGSLFSRLWR